MVDAKSTRPYFDAWLRRTGRQLAVSGRLSQVAVLLAADQGDSAEEWRLRLRSLLDGGALPSLDLLMRIDKLLARPAPKACAATEQGMLF